MKHFLIVGFVFILFGCSSPGPMQKPQGPISTPAFEPIVLDMVKDGSGKILFKEYTTLYEDKDLKSWGVFFITEHGAYMANWHSSEYKYNLSYKLPIEKLSDISEQTVERDMWIDSDLLVLKDVTGKEVGFSLYGKNAARAVLQELSSQLK
ncbi:hypothetical protein [Salinivibrio kushneri]|uniref:hypothetical protein n=1 Tax=Salinivibrio kushneri TaxID=1908198 RepID=UPI000989239E|nr:hypothetical protein [Salinivibrio kushneri]OOE64665.1 hypothetical protein BZG19_14475 [Salinivibrio kushneri]